MGSIARMDPKLPSKCRDVSKVKSLTPPPPLKSNIHMPKLDGQSSLNLSLLIMCFLCLHLTNVSVYSIKHS